MQRFSTMLRRRAACFGAALCVGLGLGTSGQAADPPRPQLPTTAQLIEQLGNPEFAVRQRAQRALAQRGFEALEALEAAVDHDDIEVASQARDLLRQVRVQWLRQEAPPEVRQTLREYEQQGDDERLGRLTALARMPDGAGLEWLCRAIYLEESAVVSKEAALRLVTGPPPLEGAAWEKLRGAVEKVLPQSDRPGARWLRALVAMRVEPDRGLAEWTRLIEAEQAALARQSSETNRRLVARLWRRLIEELDRLKRPDEALAAVRRLAELERGDPRSLLELTQYLSQRQAWDVLLEVAGRFEAQFSAEPRLLYQQARAWLGRNDRARANALAARALALAPNGPAEHAETADYLRHEGLEDWADAEYRRTIGMADQSGEAALYARWMLGESLHDRLLHQQAAEVYQGAVEAMSKDRSLVQFAKAKRSKEREPGMTTSTMHYYRACHYAASGERAKQIESLEASLAADSTNVDAVIALYRIPERREAARLRIARLTRQTLDEISREPNDPVNYNQLAWLVANSEGDLEQATQASHKSIEILRALSDQLDLTTSIASHLDTLAHCYYAKQDYAAAVKYQTEANRLEPHSRVIARQLKVFREALARQQGTPPAKP